MPRRFRMLVALVAVLVISLTGCQGLSRDQGNLSLLLSSQKPINEGTGYVMKLTNENSVRFAYGMIGKGQSVPPVTGLPSGNWSVQIRVFSGTSITSSGSAVVHVPPAGDTKIRVYVAPANEGEPINQVKGTLSIDVDLSNASFDGHVDLFGWSLYRNGNFIKGDNYHRSTQKVVQMKATNLDPGDYDLMVVFKHPDGLMYYNSGIMRVKIAAGVNLRIACSPPVGYDLKADSPPPEPRDVTAIYDSSQGNVKLEWKPGLTDEKDISGFYIYYQKEKQEPLYSVGPLDQNTMSYVVDAKALTPGKWTFWVRCMDQRGNTSKWPVEVFVNVP